MLHASKTAYVAVDDHKDAHGAFFAGDIVIVDEPALLPVLFAEGSLDPAVTVDASVFTTIAPAKVAKSVDAAPGDDAHVAEPDAPVGSGPAPAARGEDRMVTSASRRGGRRA